MAKELCSSSILVELLVIDKFVFKTAGLIFLNRIKLAFFTIKLRFKHIVFIDFEMFARGLTKSKKFPRSGIEPLT